MPELLDRCLDDGRDVLRQCHVGGHRNCTPAGLLDNRARRFEALHAARREHEVCPRLGKRLGERHPQARGGPSHDRDLAVEAEAVKHRGHICPLVQGNSSGIGQNARTQPRELGLGCLHHHPAAVSRCCIAGDAKIDEISSSQSLRHHNGRQPPSRSELTVGGSDDLGGEVPGQRAAHGSAAWSLTLGVRVRACRILAANCRLLLIAAAIRPAGTGDDRWAGPVLAPRNVKARIRDGGSCMPGWLAAPKFGPQVSSGREADLLRVSYPGSCCGHCWALPCVLVLLSCAVLAVQLASRLSASCEGEPGSVV